MKYLDSAFAIYFDERPFFSLDDGKIALPVHERVWQANTAEAWKQQWETSTSKYAFFFSSFFQSPFPPYSTGYGIY